MFYERVATFGLGITSNYTTNPPTLRQANIPYGNLSTIQSTGETFFPGSVSMSGDGQRFAAGVSSLRVVNANTGAVLKSVSVSGPAVLSRTGDYVLAAGSCSTCTIVRTAV
ncbi:MAG TPA: hypothetical protein PKK15_19135, partial [Kouleothrix sp.]|nr:hypothetical protein [Kouleothrix sp.]